MKTKTLLQVIVIYTFLILFAGLWSELAGRIKFNKWDIIGATGRVTNHNLYSNIYIRGIICILIISYFIKFVRKIKTNK